MTEQEAKELIARVRTKGSYTGDYYMSFADSSAPFNADVDILAEALEKQIADGCEGCLYQDKNEFEMPCLMCKRNKMDYFTVACATEKESNDV